MPVAGRGTRLGKMGRYTPKCLIAFEGGTLLDYAISLMKRAGITRFVFIVGHLKEQVIAHLQENHASLNSVVVEQIEQKGIISAVCCAREHLEGHPFVIFCPDNYFADYYDLHRCINSWTPSVAASVIVRHDDNYTRNRGLFHGPFEDQPGKILDIERIEPSESAGWISTGFSVEGLDFFKHTDKIAPREGEKRLFDIWRSELADKGKVLAIQMEGQLFDVSEESDALALRNALAAPTEGVAVILLTQDDSVLLMQRDKKFGIRYPGYWALFGGSVDPGEAPEVAACRELDEELEFSVSPSELSKVTQYISNLKKEYVYSAVLTKPLESLTLREGHKMQLFDFAELSELDIRDDDKQALFAYLQQEGLQ